VTNFIAKVRRSGLKLNVSGEPKITVYTLKGTVANAVTEDTRFDVMYKPNEQEALHDMYKIGSDQNGVPREVYRILGTTQQEYWQKLADPGLYPVQSTPEQLKSMVITLLESLNIGGTDRYILESVKQYQKSTYKLPFYAYCFTTADFLGNLSNRNREEVSFIIRAGGTDLAPGQGELVYFSDSGTIWRKLKNRHPKPPLQPVSDLGQTR